MIRLCDLTLPFLLPPMNTRFVETFLLLSRIGNVRRVAEVMHSTPATVSLRVRSLEEELGAPLFHYDGKTMALTPQGARAVQHAEALLESVRKMEESARDTRDGLQGRIRVGVIETVVHTCLPEVMKLMRASLPHVELDLKADLTMNLDEEMMAGDLDLVMRVSSPVYPTHAVVDDVMSVPVHWIAKRGLLPKRDLERNVLRHQLLTQVRGTQPHLDAMNSIQQLASRLGVALSELRISTAPSITGQLALVQAGVGVALVPGIFVMDQLKRGELIELDLPPLSPFKMSVWHRLNPDPLTLHASAVFRKAAHAFCVRHVPRWVSAIE